MILYYVHMHSSQIGQEDIDSFPGDNERKSTWKINNTI